MPLSRKSFPRTLGKTLLIACVITVSVFLGGGKAEAASSAWTYDYTFPTCGGTQFWVTAQNSIDSFDNITFIGWFDANGTQYFGTVLTIPGYIGDPDSYAGCLPDWTTTTQSIAWFNASSDKDVYSPGEAVSVSLSAYNGSSGNTSGILNWIFGGSGTLPVWVGANFNGSQFASCGSGGGSVSGCLGSFAAPTTPGIYPIGLVGCQNSAYCNVSSMSFCVAGGPTCGPPVCAPSYGAACTSPANACGQTSGGTYDCNGNCTASAPDLPGALISGTDQRSDPGSTYVVTKFGGSNYCFGNSGGYSYFIPANTQGEFTSLYNNIGTGLNISGLFKI